MNFQRKIQTFIFIAALLPAAFVTAAEKPVSAPPQAVKQSSASSGSVKTAPAAKKATDKKRSKHKSKKGYSKATLSAFQPIQQAPMLQGSQSAAGIALSPMVQREAVQSLQTGAATESSSTFAIAAEASTAYDEESSNAQHDRPTTAVGESSVLGEESVSVIDRFADKPKAKPLSNGPLRVRMKDSGLRASVQIPLSSNE